MTYTNEDALRGFSSEDVAKRVYAATPCRGGDLSISKEFNPVRFRAIQRAAEQFIGGEACNTVNLVTLLQDVRWGETPLAFAVAIVKTSLRDEPRATLCEEFKKVVEYTIFNAFGSTDHESVASWMMYNWTFFTYSVMEKVALIFKQRAREEPAALRRAVRAVFALAGGCARFGSFRSLDADADADGGAPEPELAVLAACDTRPETFLNNGYVQFGGARDGEDEKYQCFSTPLGRHQAVLMDEVAKAVLERTKTASTSVGTAFGYYAGSSRWRGFAWRCIKCAVEHNAAVRRTGVGTEVSVASVVALNSKVDNVLSVARARFVADGRKRKRAERELQSKLEAIRTLHDHRSWHEKLDGDLGDAKLAKLVATAAREPEREPERAAPRELTSEDVLHAPRGAVDLSNPAVIELLLEGGYGARPDALDEEQAKALQEIATGHEIAIEFGDAPDRGAPSDAEAPRGARPPSPPSPPWPWLVVRPPLTRRDAVRAHRRTVRAPVRVERRVAPTMLASSAHTARLRRAMERAERLAADAYAASVA